MKIETKQKIRRWVCKRLGVEETVEVPYSVVKTIHPPVETIGAQGYFHKWMPGSEAEQNAENVLKRQLAYQLAEAILRDDRSLITVEDAENDRMLRVMTVKVKVVHWMEG